MPRAGPVPERGEIAVLQPQKPQHASSEQELAILNDKLYQDV